MLRNVAHRFLEQTIQHSNVYNARLVHISFPTKNNGDKNDRHNTSFERVKEEQAADKAALRWRTRSVEGLDEWNSKLQLFNNLEQTSDYITQVQKPINLSPAAIKKWWTKRVERKERFMQQYIPERIEILGVELAAAHFILYRGGAVKFVGASKWVRANEEGEFDLPNRFHPEYKVEALRCDNMTLYYEGLENLRCLQNLKFLSLHNVKTFDNWCLDRLSGSLLPKLEVLDISGTSCTPNGLTCLYRIQSLQLLILDNPKQSLHHELSCSMLEQTLPYLKVVPSSHLHDDIKL